MHRAGSKRFMQALCACVVLITVSFLPQMVAAERIPPDYLGRVTETEWLPWLILYDPPGDKSFQQVSFTNTKAWTFQIKGGAFGIEAYGSVGATWTDFSTYSSAQSTDPAFIGPGKGDAIIGKVYTLTWDVFQYYYPARGYNPKVFKLVGAPFYVRDFIATRSWLSSNTDTKVEDKTGTLGQYSKSWFITQPLSYEHTVTYTWSGTVEIGFGFSVHFAGTNWGLSFSLSYSTATSVSTTCHYETTTTPISFSENAMSATPDLNNVYSYVYWFNP